MHFLHFFLHLLRLLHQVAHLRLGGRRLREHATEVARREHGSDPARPDDRSHLRHDLLGPPLEVLVPAPIHDLRAVAL